MRAMKCLLFIVEEKEGDLSGIYHKIYFVDDEEGTRKDLNEKYADKEFPTGLKVRGSTPFKCSIAGWGFESLSTESATQPLYESWFPPPRIPSHLHVFSLSSHDPQGRDLDKYKGFRGNFFKNPIRLALDPETYPQKDSEGKQEGVFGDLNESEMLKIRLRDLCVDGFCMVGDAGQKEVITINGWAGNKARIVFKGERGTVMGSLNTSIMGERLFTETDIELYLGSLVDEDMSNGCEKVKELEYIFLEKSSRGETYELVGNAQGKVDIQSNLDKDYKSGMRRFDMDENKSSARKTMSRLNYSRACCFDTHPEYPLLITATEGAKHLLILRLDADDKVFIKERGGISEEAAASRVSDSDWVNVDPREVGEYVK